MSEALRASTPPSNALFSAIVGTVAASSERLTVRDIAARVSADAAVTAHCIALHRYFRSQIDASGEPAQHIAFPPPDGFVVPALDEVIDQRALGIAPEPEPEGSASSLAIQSDRFGCAEG